METLGHPCSSTLSPHPLHRLGEFAERLCIATVIGVMLASVLTPRESHEVFRTIVGSDAIQVVRVLVRLEKAPQLFFEDDTALKDVPSEAATIRVGVVRPVDVAVTSLVAHPFEMRVERSAFRPLAAFVSSNERLWPSGIPVHASIDDRRNLSPHSAAATAKAVRTELGWWLDASHARADFTKSSTGARA
jgi:hypothetical protein